MAYSRRVRVAVLMGLIVSGVAVGAQYVLPMPVDMFGWASTRPQVASLIEPQDGASEVDPFRPFVWGPISEPTVYVLEIGTTPGGTDVFRSDEVAGARLWIPDLPGGLVFVRLWTKLDDDDWRSTDSAFTVGSQDRYPAPHHFYQFVAERTGDVRLMADGRTNDPLPGTPLEDVTVANGRERSDCTDYATALRSALEAEGVTTRLRGVTLTGTNYEAHTVLEFFDPFRLEWGVADPTFGVAYYDEQDLDPWAVEDLSDLVRDRAWSRIPTVYVTDAGPDYLNGYYMDPMLLFLNSVPVGELVSDAVLRPPDPYLEEVDPGQGVGRGGGHIFRFSEEAPTSLVIRDGRSEELDVGPEKPREWSRLVLLDEGWEVDEWPDGVRLYTIPRVVY